MKELKTILQQQPELHALKKIPRKALFIDSFILQPGQKAFKFEWNTGKITELTDADFEAVTADYADPKKLIHKKLTIKEGALYCAAINRKNAAKKFKKALLNLIK